MNTHQQLRAALWCNVATGIAEIPTVTKKEAPAEWADHILKDFDERFPEAGPVDNDPEVVLLQKELETERMRLAAVSVVACADTPESAAFARQMHPDYRSASLHDVERRVDECIALRKERDAIRVELEILNADRDGLRAERDALLRWKEEMLEVNRRWDAVGEFIRQHPSTTIGKFVDSEALRLMRERDVYHAQLLAADIHPRPLI